MIAPQPLVLGMYYVTVLPTLPHRIIISRPQQSNSPTTIVDQAHCQTPIWRLSKASPDLETLTEWFWMRWQVQDPSDVYELPSMNSSVRFGVHQSGKSRRFLSIQHRAGNSGGATHPAGSWSPFSSTCHAGIYVGALFLGNAILRLTIFSNICHAGIRPGLRHLIFCWYIS